MMELYVNYFCGFTYFSPDLIQSIFRNDSFILIVTCNHTIIYDYLMVLFTLEQYFRTEVLFITIGTFVPSFFYFNLVGCRIFYCREMCFYITFCYKTIVIENFLKQSSTDGLNHCLYCIKLKLECCAALGHLPTCIQFVNSSAVKSSHTGQIAPRRAREPTA